MRAGALLALVVLDRFRGWPEREAARFGLRCGGRLAFIDDHHRKSH